MAEVGSNALFNALASCARNVQLQVKTCSSVAPKLSQNTFVASDKHARLQCNIVFGGEQQRLSSLAMNEFVNSVITYSEEIKAFGDYCGD